MGKKKKGTSSSRRPVSRKKKQPRLSPHHNQSEGGKDVPIATSKVVALQSYIPSSYYSFGIGVLWRAIHRPYDLVERDWLREVPHMILVFLGLMFLYGYTAPRLVGFEDDGLFLMNMEFFGVAHPPGYPLHSLLGGIFYHVFPWGTPAFKGHLFSGFAGSIACVAIYAAIAMLIRGRFFAYAGAFGYGVSATFWSQAIIAEVYTLNAMMFFIVFALCIKYASHRDAPTKSHLKLFCLIATMYGLGLSNHWPLIGLGSIGLLLIVWSQRWNILQRSIWGLVFLAIGLSPYIWMAFRSLESNIASFYGPLDTMEKFIFYILRSGYSGVDNQEGVGWDDKWAFFSFISRQMFYQFTPVGFIFSVIGFFSMALSRFNALWFSMLVSWFMSSMFLLLMLNFQAEYIWFAAFRVYPLVAYGLMAIWMAFGMAWVTDKVWAWNRRFRPMLAGAFTVSVVIGSIMLHWPENNRRDYSWAHDFSLFKLNSVEPDTVLFTFDDLDVPIGYLRYVEGIRPDVDVLNDQGLVFGNRLYSPLISENDKKRVILEYIREEERPVYYHPLRQTLFADSEHGSDFLGFFRRVNDVGGDRIVLNENLRGWLERALDSSAQTTDLWTRHQNFNIIATLAGAIMLASTSGFELTGEWAEVIERTKEQNLLARIIIDSHQLNAQALNKEELLQEWEWTESVVPEKYIHMDTRGWGNFYVLKARIAFELWGDQDNKNMEESLLRSLEMDNSPSNSAVGMILRYYYANEMHEEFLGTYDDFYAIDDEIPPDIERMNRLLRKQLSEISETNEVNVNAE